MVGRKGAVDREELYNVFSSYEDKIIENGRVVAPTSEAWKKLSESLSNTNPKAIYSAALRWYRSENEKHEVSEVICYEFDDISMEDSGDASTSLNTTDSPKCERINLNIYLSADVWKRISPVPVRHNRCAERNRKNRSRIVMTLKKGVWSNIILEKIAKHRKNVICNWSFKSAKVYVSGKFYVTITAKCINCGANLQGFMKKKPVNDNEMVKMCFTVKNFNEELHATNTKTVKSQGDKVKKIQESAKSALALQQELAEEYSMFQNPKGRPFTLNAIRCAKYHHRNEKKLSDDPFKALMYLQEMKAYANTIHMNGQNPLIFIYTSPGQIRLFKAYKKHNRYIRMSCDATGSLVLTLGMSLKLFFFANSIRIL